MKYTEKERMERLWELVEGDADCAACREDLIHSEGLLNAYLEDQPKEISMTLWAHPTCINTYYQRILELVCREMRFGEEI